MAPASKITSRWNEHREGGLRVHSHARNAWKEHVRQTRRHLERGGSAPQRKDQVERVRRKIQEGPGNAV